MNPLTGIVATSKVISSIFFARNKLLRVEQLPISSCPHFINNSGLEIQKDATGHMLTSTCFREKGVEGIIATSNGLVRRHLRGKK